jgi:uncharacterized protein with ParB-like and HNH nuclease domain
MKANEARFQDLVASNYQYVVPLFQRPYSWTRKEWDQLWEDVKELVDSGADHFLGSIVNIPTPSVPAGVNKYLLIDGQQRMLTLFIILVVLRDKATEEDYPELADEINDMIVNRHKKDNDFYKLMPTQVDRQVFKELVAARVANASSLVDTSIHACYRFFRLKLSKEQIEPIFKVISSQLSIVSIVLDPNDNPHVVFESLNAKGRSLSQADLIRNYFFMRIHVNEHDEINAQFWQPLQDALNEDMTEFIRHFLMRGGAFVRQPDVYQVLKQRVEAENPPRILEFLRQLHQFGQYYKRILRPELYELNDEIKFRMKRLNSLKVTVAYPFLLNVYDDLETGRLTRSDVVEILTILENYIFRRAICGVPTYELNKMFPFLYEWSRSHVEVKFTVSLRKELQKRRYPRDEDFKHNLITEPLYGAGEKINRVRYLLETLENSYGHKENADLSKCSIEHIFPQTPDAWWRQHLGDAFDEVCDDWLHCLGNLTLSAYNSELSNGSFDEKRTLLKTSNIMLNRELSEYSTWTLDSIKQRAEALADRALKIWPDFRVVTEGPISQEDNVAGKKPYSVKILGQDYVVNTWVEVLKRTMEVIYELTPEKMFELRDEFPRWISDTPFKRRSEPLENGMYLNLYANGPTIVKICRRMVEFVGLEQTEWQLHVE